MDQDKLAIYAVGDILPDYANPEDLFKPSLHILKKADILFGQLEQNLSEKGEPQLYCNTDRKIPPSKVAGLTFAGFDIMSFASNHTLDRGEVAFYETLETLKQNNIAVLGAGKNIEEARRPVIFEKKGVKVGFLGYCSVLPKGYEAGVEKCGAAPMRASTYYEQVDWQPGTPPRILTFANKDDLAALVEDVKKLRPKVDVLIMSIHWGVHFVPEVLAMYQKEVGYAAIDAGVDLIIGHHAHILKGIEVYKGKVIFYSLCNFAQPGSTRRKRESKSMYGIKPDPEYPFYLFPPDSRKTIIAKCTIADRKIERVSFIPAIVNKLAQPEIPRPTEPGFADVVDYMRRITENQGLNAKYTTEGDEVAVTA